jgi:hypothetical protein
VREIRLVSDRQQPPVDADTGHRIERLRTVEAARQRHMQSQELLLLGRPCGAGKLGGLPRSHLGAEQDRLELSSHARNRTTRSARLLGAALGQAALRVLARAVRLGLSVSK